MWEYGLFSDIRHDPGRDARRLDRDFFHVEHDGMFSSHVPTNWMLYMMLYTEPIGTYELCVG